MYDPLRAKTKAALSVAGAFILGLGIASQFGFTERTFDMPSIQTAPAVSDAEVRPALDLSRAFVNVAEAVTPAVVRIEASRERQREDGGGGLDWFFGPQRPRGDLPGISTSSGSGFIVSGDGYALTNNHVVAGADGIKVVLADGREFGARVVGTDPTTDVAVVKIEAEDDLPAAALGSSADVNVGEWVLAIGNPGFGRRTADLDYTVTAGIVSALNRSLQLIDRTLNQDPDFRGDPSVAIEDFIQTDAVINSGNSGGPMVNLRGQVIGINSAIVSQNGLYQGYGFAIPIDLAHRVMDDLIAYGRVKRARLGVSINDVDALHAESLGLPEVSGALVQAVTEDSPAERAGLLFRDVITEVDGEKVMSGNDLQHKIALKAPDDRVRLAIFRDGHRRELTARLEEASYSREAEAAPVRAPRATDKLGIVGVRDVDAEVAEALGLESTDGVVVEDVQQGGPAARRGIGRSCVITEIDRREIQDPGDARAALEDAEPGDVVALVASCPRTGPDGGRAPRLYSIRVPR